MKLAAYLLVSLSSLGTAEYKRNQSEVELRHHIEVCKGEHLKIVFQ